MKNFMKHAVTAAAVVMAMFQSFTALGQTNTNNYMITKAPRIAGVTSDSLLKANSTDKYKMQTGIQYMDGLGRPVQTIQQQGSPLGFDIIRPQAYDTYGREVTKYLPYAPESGTAGSFRSGAVSSQQGFFTSPNIGSNVSPIANANAPTAFDNSPLNRPVEQGAPGTPWQLGAHTMKMVYAVNNNTAFSADTVNGTQVKMYQVGINSDMSRYLTASGTYPAGSLTITVVKDENWTTGRMGTTEEYKDIDGQVILKRTYVYANGAPQQLSTYYVYDDLGKLAFVLPPMANPDGASVSQATLDNFCYQYWYDERGRMFRKKLPGKGWDFMVYDNMDRLRFTQDANQRAQTPQQETFIKYDALNRQIITGLGTFTNSTADTSMSTPNNGNLVSQQNYMKTNQNPPSEARNNSATSGYDGLSTPIGQSYTFYTISYYDDYLYPGKKSTFTTPTGADLATRGEVTGTRTGVLGSATTLYSSNYYDYFGRSLKVYKQHYLGAVSSANNFDAVSTTYDFTNVPTTTTRQHWNAASTAYPRVTVFNKYIYDHMGRKLKTWEQITNTNQMPDTARLISAASYNEIGQVYSKKLHSTDSVNYLQSLAYIYNERGWLRNLNSGLLGQELRYNTPDVGPAQYNGNISEYIYTKTGTGLVSVLYSYDRLNRLTYSGSSDALSEAANYDAGGNISNLTRLGTSAATLAYTYRSGNQLGSVTNGGAAFRSYSYDGNGNATTDGGLSASAKTISYNLLNLPQSVSQNGTTLATYTYAADGEKLRNSGSDGYWDYDGGIVYNGTTSNNGTIQFIQTEEGRAVPQGSSWNYTYDLKDHLGNVRLSFDKNPSTGAARRIQEDEYYAFGLRSAVYNNLNNNRYLYNGKELQTDLQNQYDYGARFYDPVIARWSTIDPLAEISRRWSPYNYVENDPVRLTDPDGMAVDYSGSGVTYTGADAVNFAYGRKIADAVSKDDKDKERKKAKDTENKKEQQKNKEPSELRKWVNATPIIGSAAQAGDEWGKGNYLNATLSEATGMLEMFTFAEGAVQGISESAWNSLVGLFKETPVNSAKMGELIGWGTSGELADVEKTTNVVNDLTKGRVEYFKLRGLPKSWVQNQLKSYLGSEAKGGPKLINKQLDVRIQLMEKILKLW